MKMCAASWSACIFGALLLVSTVSEGLRPNPYATAGSSERDNRRRERDDLMSKEEIANDGVGEGVYATTGSSLPDCSHACGPCFPCKRVMVSFKCFVAESCPIVYRCMCKGKYYHVPSN